MNEFYLTLPSNCSMTEMPKNKTSSFTVNLPRYITLEGDWYVSLVDIHFPYTFFNVSDGNNSITIHFGHQESIVIIEPGWYIDIQTVLTAVNEAMQAHTNNPSYLTLDKATQRVKTGKKASHPALYITFQARLAMQLGFEPDQKVFDGELSPNVANINLGIPESFLVYCDLVDAQYFGDTMAKILRVINTTDKAQIFGDTCYKQFNSLQYYKVREKKFEKISIDIRGVNGELLPFRFGVLTLQLHFKRN